MRKEFYPLRTLLMFLLSLVGVNVAQSQTCDCDRTVGASDVVVDNAVLNLPAGSTICIQAGIRNSSQGNTLEFRNFISEDPSQRYIFKNCGGQVIIRNSWTQAHYITKVVEPVGTGIVFSNCKNFRLTGSGDANVEYGILIEGMAAIGSLNGPKWGIRAGGKSTDFEIDRVKITDILASGMDLKTDPSCSDPSAWRDAFTMRNVSVHHNFVDGTQRGEGFYIGYTGYSEVTTCSGGAVMRPHTIDGLRVFENMAFNTASEGIQVGSASNDCEIYNNRIENYGLNPLNGQVGAHGNGMQVGNGTTGLCYNNYIKAVTGIETAAGIKCFGINNVIFNNIIVQPAKHGIYVDEGGGSDTGPGSGYRVYNNVIIEPDEHGIWLLSEAVDNNWVKNNIIVKSAGTGEFIHLEPANATKPAVTAETSNNYLTTSISSVQFADAPNGDYHLTQGSPAIDNGVNLYSEGVTIDFDQVARPASGPFEQGAFEFSTNTCDCDYTVGAAELLVDNAVLNLPAGSVICIPAGVKTSSQRVTLEFRNFISENSSQRFIFKNCGGQAIIRNTRVEGQTTPEPVGSGIVFSNCKNFRLTGSGDAGVEYGILIEGAPVIGSLNGPKWGIRAGGKSTDFEIDRVKITDVLFAGMDLKTDPSCSDPSAWRDAFTMRNVSVHNNFVDGTQRGEGFYIGYTGYSEVTTCSGGAVMRPHTIDGLRVFENKAFNTASEGIQVGSASNDCEIYGNRIENYGLNPLYGQVGAHGNGMQVGDGTTGLVYNNYFKAPSGIETAAGIKCFGINNVIFNNIIVQSAKHGIYVDEAPGSDTGAGSGYRIYNNVIIEPDEHGIWLLSEAVDNNWVKNNIIVKSAGTGEFIHLEPANGTKPAVTAETSNNYLTTSISSVQFADAPNGDYHLTEGSPAIDNGVNLYSEGVTLDFDHVARPASGPFEQGAFEFDGDTTSTFSLFINAGGNEFVEDANTTWEADKKHATNDDSFYTYATGSEVTFSGVNNTSAPDQVLGSSRYTEYAFTTIRYNIPVPTSGDYDVEVYFARKSNDTWTSGHRRFNILIEGATVASAYDVYDQGGTGGTGASSVAHTATVTDGFLELKFVAVTGSHSMVNAIRVNGPVTSGAMMMQSMGQEEAVQTYDVYPNPANQFIDIGFTENDVYEIKVLGPRNEIYLTTRAEVPEGGGSQRIDISGLPPYMMYIVQIRSSKGLEIFKVFKK